MERVRLMLFKLLPASSLRGKSLFLRRSRLGFGLLAVLGLLYVSAYHFAQGPIQGLAELPDWPFNTTRDVRVYIQPGIDTTIISPIGICISPPLLIVIVCSSVANRKERQAIRDTWANKSILKNVFNSTVEVVFLLGESHKKTLNEVLKHENSQHGDIIQEKFYDTYNNLTLKSVMMLKWVTSNCGQAKFLMKTDDDMLVNIPVLVRLLQAKSQLNRVLIGCLYRNTKPIVNSKKKWYMPKYMYSEATYPNYLSGSGYVMSSDVALKLYNTALDTPLLHIEDVYLTGVCARRAKLRPTNHPNFYFGYDSAPRPDPCIIRNVITVHKMSASKLYRIWNELKGSPLMVRVRLLPLELPLTSSSNNKNVTGRGRSSFLRCLGLGFAGLLALLGLLYVPTHHSAQGPIEGLAELLDWSSDTTRDVRVYIRPEIDTTIISPTGICTCPPFLIVIVASSVANQKKRQALRDTWANKSILKNVFNLTVEVVFLTGESHNETLNEVLKHENSQHGDIIQEKFHDTYNNLTLKSVMMLKWVTSNCGQAKFFMKTDDDMFVNIPVLVKLLQAKSQPNRVLVGCLHRNAKPIVDSKSKWYMPKYMYSEATYPNYLSGSGYVMSSDVALKLYNTALDTPLLHIEDVFLTGVCARRAKLRPTHHPDFHFGYNLGPLEPDPCIFRRVITSHKISGLKIHEMWNKLNNSTLVCANSSPNTK